MNWLQKVSGKVSDAIPNEFSQLNGFSKFLPAPFNFLVQTPAALDRFGETYSNGGSFGDSAIYGAGAFAGQGGDPNKYGTGKKNWADSLGGIGNLAGSFSGNFNSGGQHINSDGSGVYGEYGAPTVNAETGELVSGGMDIGKIFDAFQQAQTQPSSDVYSPDAHAELIRSRYPWIPQQAFQSWLSSQPPTPSVQFASQTRL